VLELRDNPVIEAAPQSEWHCPDIDWPAVECFLNLVRVAGYAMIAIDHHLARHNLTRGRFMVLGVLARESPKAMCPSELAAVCGVTRATITGLVDSLERDGMVTREMSPADRRMMPVRLTDEGRAFLDKAMPDYYRRVAQATIQLSQSEKVAMQSALAKIKSGMSALTAH
jgi:DNA-binding MarR family transcriptional regulator